MPFIFGGHMKVDAKIVQRQEKTGFFSSKTLHELQYTIQLTDVEKAVINKHGLHEFVIIPRPIPEQIDMTIGPWVNPLPGPGRWWNENLLVVQMALKDLKENLTQLKKAIETAQTAPTEDSFEI
jgi:hypothetical protein